MKFKFLFFIFCLLLLSGCVASKSSLVSYANSRYGNAKLISYSKDSDSSYAIFLDKDYNFQYRVNSYMSSIDIDGSYFGSVPSKSDNYREMFVSYLKSNIGDGFSNFDCDCSISWNDDFNHNNYLIRVDFNSSDVSDCLIKIGDLVSSYDKKGFLNGTNVSAYYNDSFYGKYDFSSKSFFSREESKIDWAKNYLYYYLSSFFKNVKSKDIKFLKYEIMDAHSVPGIDGHIINEGVGITDETLKNTAVYYFIYKGETWIVADVVVDGGRIFVNKIS